MHCRFVAASILAFFSVSGAAMAGDCPGNPDALGTSRTITIDPAEYQRLGTTNYKQTLPLEDHEVVLTFDDGPIPPHTNEVLDTLKAQCVKATFFVVGEMVRAHPDTLRREYNEGHTIGTHTDHHPFMHRLTPEKAKKEIADAILSAEQALGDKSAVAPFFRFPYLDVTSADENIALQMGLSIWSIDFNGSDWTFITPEKVAALSLKRLEEKKKGILLLHDIHDRTAKALPIILSELKKRGYRIVHVVPATGAVAKIEEKPAEKTAEAAAAAGAVQKAPVKTAEATAAKPEEKAAVKAERVVVASAEQKTPAKTEALPAPTKQERAEKVASKQDHAEKKEPAERRRYALRAEHKKTSEGWHTHVNETAMVKPKKNAFESFFDDLWRGNKRDRERSHDD